MNKLFFLIFCIKVQNLTRKVKLVKLTSGLVARQVHQLVARQIALHTINLSNIFSFFTYSYTI